MVDSSPKIVGLAIDLHKDLIEVPLPLRDLAHVARSADADLAGEHRAETVHPLPHALVANVDPAFVEEVFNIAQREREPDIHHHRELDDLGRRLEISERITGHLVTLAGSASLLNWPFPLTIPARSIGPFR